MDKVIELVEVTQNDDFNILLVYSLGKEICMLANDVNLLINPSNNQSKIIHSIDDELPIHKTCDLAFKGQDILELTELKNASRIGEIIDDLIFQVITHHVKNTYEELKNYTLDTYFRR